MNKHRVAISAVFVLHGAGAGSVATRIPWFQDRFDLGPTLLGLVLLCPTIGAFVGMPLAGRVAHRLGTRTATRLMLVLWAAVFALPALAPSPLALVPLFLLYGVLIGMLDVVMNAHAVVVERALERPVMSGLHGLWCVGSLAGGGIGALAAQTGTDARLHLGAMAVTLLLVGVAAGPFLLADTTAPDAPAPRRFALPTRAVAALGLVGFCATFAEGASANWTAVYLIEVTGAGPGPAAASYTFFMLCMATARLAGDRLVRRFGPVATVRYGGVLAVAGGIVVVTSRTTLLSVPAFALIGVGVAVVVPLVITAAGNASASPGEGVASMTTITYLSGLAAPAVTGWLAGTVSYPAAFVVITAVVGLMTVRAGALRPRTAPSGTLTRSPAPEPSSPSEAPARRAR
ncbi:MFS transporter [Actinomadura kijaniata]|uniref:MFS transporter n=1 Tax=Actinomadura kijaniata TaxID=46161 RepID=UPI000832FC87|nr:MFS transporter [Actinomadura kijaniata]